MKKDATIAVESCITGKASVQMAVICLSMLTAVARQNMFTAGVWIKMTGPRQGGQLATVVVNDSVTREAITIKQERDFLEFVKQDKHFSRYYDGIFILFHTGLRVSEFVGLTVADIDLKKRKINIDHQAFYIWTKTRCQWLCFTGSIISNVSVRNTIVFTKYRCRR